MDPDLRDMSQRVHENCGETVIEMGEARIANLDDKSTVYEGKVEEEGEKGSSCVVIDVSGNEFLGENQRVCRICHLSAKESGKSLMDLIEIGCECKGELGVSHLDCAEAWFRVRGNRICEICGKTAENITGVRDSRFMEDWNERRLAGSSSVSGSGSTDGNQRCLSGQPLCNFLMACLVVAFVLPWFFRVNVL